MSGCQDSAEAGLDASRRDTTAPARRAWSSDIDVMVLTPMSECGRSPAKASPPAKRSAEPLSRVAHALACALLGLTSAMSSCLVTDLPVDPLENSPLQVTIANIEPSVLDTVELSTCPRTPITFDVRSAVFDEDPEDKVFVLWRLNGAQQDIGEGLAKLPLELDPCTYPDTDPVGLLQVYLSDRQLDQATLNDDFPSTVDGDEPRLIDWSVRVQEAACCE